ncbi:MAG TPA: tetratricopeptide repeat protein [Novosphingobium sp.]|nr:tetratricopeptide repeat protein [Novosphingobium sp.]
MGSIVRHGSAAPSAQVPDRLDGWKAIAAYLNRDRTTVIRWARERSLPVHRLPGGKTATVFALRHELDGWTGGFQSPSPAIEELPAAAMMPTRFGPPIADVPPAGMTLAPVHRHWVALVALAGLVIAFAALLAVYEASGATTQGKAAPLALPADPAVAARFLAARDLIAEREAHGLERAIAQLERVVRDAPDYALGHASLAEALLLSREFGMRRDTDAFRRARSEAETATRLDPSLAAGHRMTGFIAYWADHDFAQADARFRRALALDPADALSHFWYGNILSDHGEHAAALRELNRARLMLPGSVAIRTDLAWARWAAGDETAVRALKDIARDHPRFAVVHDCLAVIALANGDAAGYVRHFARFAALRQDAGLVARAGELDAALRRGPAAMRGEIMHQALAETTHDPARNHAWPAMVASVTGDRARLRAALEIADSRDERWGDAGMLLRMERAWRRDAEIQALLDRRRSWR